MVNAQKFLYSILALVVVAGIFQLFFRYTYLRPASGHLIYRIDRVTQHVCEIAPVNACAVAPETSAPSLPPFVIPTPSPSHR